MVKALICVDLLDPLVLSHFSWLDVPRSKRARLAEAPVHTKSVPNCKKALAGAAHKNFEESQDLIFSETQDLFRFHSFLGIPVVRELEVDTAIARSQQHQAKAPGEPNAETPMHVYKLGDFFASLQYHAELLMSVQPRCIIDLCVISFGIGVAEGVFAQNYYEYKIQPYRHTAHAHVHPFTRISHTLL